MSVSVDLNSTERVMYQGNNHVKCIYGPNNQLLWSEEEYFTVELNGTATLAVQCYGNATPVTLYYWVNKYPNGARDNYDGVFTSTSAGYYIQNLVDGDIIRFYRAETTAWQGETDSDYNKFRIGNSTTKIYGNLASLFGFSNTIPQSACFQMFAYEGVYDASGLILPWDTLSENCFRSMFLGSKLVYLPILTANHLADYCYRTMFRNTQCTNIAHMTIKDIDAAYAHYCMYQLCNNITSVTIPAFRTYNTNSLSGMFWGAPNLTTAVLNVPDNVTSNVAFSQLFINCSNLSNVTCLSPNPNVNVYHNWLSGVAETGTFIKAAGVTWPSGDSGIPYNWTVVEV